MVREHTNHERQHHGMAEFIYSMRKVRKAHGDKVILDDVSLNFLPGAKIGVVGPNGAGKSSVLRIMAGLDTPNNGDALIQPGVRWITILEGINDITGGSRGPGAPTITAEALIAAYRQMIEMAHLYGVKVIGCTITPYGGSNVYNEYGESVRSAVNEWIRTGRGFDANKRAWRPRSLSE